MSQSAEFDMLAQELVGMVQLVESAMSRAGAALLDADSVLAGQVADDDAAVDALRVEVDDRVVVVLTGGQTAATDLRTLITYLRISSDLEQMGEEARQVAELTRLRYPKPVVPTRLRNTIRCVGVVARRMAAEIRGLITSPTGVSARKVERARAELSELLDPLYRRMSRGTVTEMDMNLLGRCYERYADHAVSVARQLACLAVC